MSRILVLSVIVASLSTIVGCGASSRATRYTATPASVNVAEVRDEACWSPPEEGLQIREAKAPEGSSTTASSESLKNSYRPNRQERPITGAVHAATY